MKHLTLTLGALMMLLPNIHAQNIPAISVGTAAANPGLCNPVTVGNIYVRSQNYSNGPIGTFRCTQQAPTIYGWLPVDHFVGGTLPTKCDVGDMAFKTGVTAGLNIYGCTSADAWTAQAGGSGGSSAFDALTSGTNTTAAMVVGSGGTLAPSSATAGVVSANQLNGTQMSGMTTGLLHVTTTTGAVVGGLLVNADITSATIDLTAKVTGILPTANGGTANAFFTVSGPASSAKTFTFPNASATVLTTSAAVTAGQGGTGVANTATLTLGSSNQNWATLGTGIVKNTTTTGAITDAVSADVYGLWSGSCSSSTFLRGDGACATPSGTGTVTVVSSGSLTSTALVTGGGSQTLQTPSATSTLDTSGNLGLAGVLTATGGVASGSSAPSVTAGTGGVWASAEGTVPSACAATSVGCIYNDSTQHGLLMSRNNGSYLPIPQGPASTTSGNLASWNGTNGGLLADGGVVAANVITDSGSLTNHGVVLGTAAKTVSSLAAAAAGTVLGGVASSDPAFTATPTLGVAGTTKGTLAFAGNTSGTVTIQPVAAAGTWSMTLPTSGGSNGQFLQTDGAGVTSWGTASGAGTAGATLFSTTASTTVTAASATTLIGTVTGSTTIAANTFTAGSLTEIHAQGYYTGFSTRTLTIDLKIGGSTRLTTGAIAVPVATNGVWRLFCGITTRTAGASGTQIGNCIFEATGATLTAAGEGAMQTASTWTVDTTGTLAVDLQATWDSTTGAPTITATNVAAWIPGAPVTSVAGATGATLSDFTYSSSTLTSAAAGKIDLSGSTGASAFKIPVGAGLTSAADGAIAYDSTAKLTHVRTNGADSSVVAATATSTTTTQVLHATAVAGIGAFSAIAAGDLPATLTSGTAITNAALTTPAIGAATGASVVLTGSLTSNALTSGRIPIAGTSGILADDADLTFATDTLTATKIVGSTSITDTGLTAGRVTFAGTAGILADDADMTFATDTLTITKVVASTSLTVAGAAITNNVVQNSQSAAYTTVIGDAGKHIYHPSADTTARTWTIDSNANVAYPIGTTITFVNDTSAGTLTIAITSDTMVLAGTATTGSRTLAAGGIATAIKMTSTRWLINGAGLT